MNGNRYTAFTISNFGTSPPARFNRYDLDLSKHNKTLTVGSPFTVTKNIAAS